ncbi:hypothetical protein BDV12DRAFT_203859 [Aspergillus spectabilis]
MTLTDRGGFSRLNTTYPTWDIAAVQSNPQLWKRARTRSPVIQHLCAEQTEYRQCDTGHRAQSTSSPTRQKRSAISPNAFGCYANNRTDLPEDGTFGAAPRIIRDLCEGGEFGRSRGTLGNIAAYCTLMLGASQRSESDINDENNNWPLHTPNSAWSIPMYSCAMAIAATIKTVTFSFNTTDGLTGLTVLNITDKTYATGTDQPIWAVESLSVDMGQFWMRPLWGLVSAEAAAHYSPEQLKTIQKPSLLLPRSKMLPRGNGVVPQDTQNLPGVEFPNAGMDAVAGMAYGTSGLIDYTGEGNLALSRRWNVLLRSADSMARVMDLVWTDYVANAVVGTKGSPQESGNSGSGSSSSSSAVPRRDVTTYRTAIQYHLPYAIPAVIMLAILALTSFLALVAFLLGRATLAKMKRYLNATSTGRIMISALHRPLVVARGVDNDTPTGEWVATEGKIGVSAGKIMPVPLLNPGLGGAERSTLLKGPVVGQKPLQT